jgi:hypothetical protein
MPASCATRFGACAAGSGPELVKMELPHRQRNRRYRKHRSIAAAVILLERR